VIKIRQCVSKLSLYRRNTCLQQSSLNCNVHARSRSIHSGLTAIFLFVIGFHTTMAVAEALPHWVSNPPHDSQRWMYGIGSGPTLQQAQQDALKNIAGKLMTNIKAVTESRAISRNGLSTQSFEQNIQTYVNATHLSSFNTISTASYQYGYFILIRMSRSNFVRNTRMRLEQLNQTIAIGARDAEKARNLRRFVAYRSLLPKINNAEELGILLQSADHNFSAAQYLSNYARYRERAQIVANETRLMIKSTPQLHPLLEVIARILSDAKIATTSHMPANGIVLLQLE